MWIYSYWNRITGYTINIQGAYGKFLQNILDIYEAYNEAIKMCNTAMEREFCQLLEYV